MSSTYNYVITLDKSDIEYFRDALSLLGIDVDEVLYNLEKHNEKFMYFWYAKTSESLVEMEPREETLQEDIEDILELVEEGKFVHYGVSSLREYTDLMVALEENTDIKWQNGEKPTEYVPFRFPEIPHIIIIEDGKYMRSFALNDIANRSIIKKNSLLDPSLLDILEKAKVDILKKVEHNYMQAGTAVWTYSNECVDVDIKVKIKPMSIIRGLRKK